MDEAHWDHFHERESQRSHAGLQVAIPEMLKRGGGVIIKYPLQNASLAGQEATAAYGVSKADSIH